MKKSRVNDAVILPLLREELLPRGVMSHGVLLGESDPPHFGHFRKNRNVIDRAAQRKRLTQSTLQRLTGTWLYGGMLLPHFGHLLSECVHRLWAWQECDRCQGVLFVAPAKFQAEPMPAFVDAVLGYFGVPQDRVHLLFAPTSVESLVVPEQCSGLGMSAAGRYGDFLRTLQSACPAGSDSPKKLFVSRRGYLDRGRVAGMDWLARALQSCGYVEFCPQDHAFPRQLQFLSASEKIVFEEGSAIHLLDVLPGIKAEVFIIKRRPKYSLFDELVNTRTARACLFDAVVEAPPLSEGALEKSNGLAFVSSLTELLEALERTGFAHIRQASPPEFLAAQKCDVFDFVMSRHLKKGFGDRLPEFLNFVEHCLVRSESS